MSACFVPDGLDGLDAAEGLDGTEEADEAPFDTGPARWRPAAASGSGSTSERAAGKCSADDCCAKAAPVANIADAIVNGLTAVPDAFMQAGQLLA